MVDTTVNMGVNSLYSLLFSGSSCFLPNFWASEVSSHSCVLLEGLASA